MRSDGTTIRLARLAWATLAAVAFCTTTREARAESIDYTCTGVHITHRSTNPVASRETVTVQSKDKGFQIGLPDSKQPVEAQTVADNGQALVLRASDLTLQYMRLTGQLFVIHDDGRLTRLACAQRK